MEKIRKHVIVKGSVQGVGFRYRAYYAARELGLTGYVKNLYDGSVELELQGDRAAMSQFFPKVEQGHFIHIDDMDVKMMAVDEEERDFKVVSY